jgi:pimeloyl-ACP methyl ester carboxylesterase
MYKAVTALSNQQPYILAGISLATNIIAEMLAYPLSPAGIVLAGPCIIGGIITMAQMIKPDTQVGIVFTDEANAEDIQQYAAETSLSTDVADGKYFIKNYQAVQKPFRSLLGQSIAAQNMSDEIALLQQQGIPLLVVFGKDEKVVHTGYLDNVALPLWNDTIYQLPGASHLVNIDQPEAFNQLLAAYSSERFK